MNSRKIFIAVLLLAGITAFFALDLGRYFSLTFIKDSQASFAELFSQRPVMVMLVFFATYVAITALSLPGAAILTLAGGAIFGLLVWGTIVVSFASSVGATLAFLASRYVLRDSGRGALWAASGRGQWGHRKGGRVLPVHAAPGARWCRSS